MRIFQSIQPRQCKATLALTAALGSLASTAIAAPAVLSASGSYNLGTDLSTGATISPTTACGNAGTDARNSTIAGSNGIALHSYSCGFGNYQFGSRSSGENTYFVTGSASVTGDIDLGMGGKLFNFVINNGQVGAFGSSSFGAGEYQESQLSIKLTINGVSFMDELFFAKIGAGGLKTNTYTSGAANQLGNVLLAGNGYVSYSFPGAPYSLDLSSLNVTDGIYDVSYVMTSLARGNVSNTTICNGPNFRGDSFPGSGIATFCGAGAKSGDPSSPISRPQLIPEPNLFALMGLAGGMLALSGAKRRRRNRS